MIAYRDHHVELVKVKRLPSVRAYQSLQHQGAGEATLARSHRLAAAPAFEYVARGAGKMQESSRRATDDQAFVEKSGARVEFDAGAGVDRDVERGGCRGREVRHPVSLARHPGPGASGQNRTKGGHVVTGTKVHEEQEHDALVVEELLVEEVSIDGLCGVY